MRSEKTQLPGPGDAVLQRSEQLDAFMAFPRHRQLVDPADRSEQALGGFQEHLAQVLHYAGIAAGHRQPVAVAAQHQRPGHHLPAADVEGPCACAVLHFIPDQVDGTLARRFDHPAGLLIQHGGPAARRPEPGDQRPGQVLVGHGLEQVVGQAHGAFELVRVRGHLGLVDEVLHHIEGHLGRDRIQRERAGPAGRHQGGRHPVEVHPDTEEQCRNARSAQAGHQMLCQPGVVLGADEPQPGGQHDGARFEPPAGIVDLAGVVLP